MERKPGVAAEPDIDMEVVRDFLRDYPAVEGTIRERIEGFRRIWMNRDLESMLKELVFCLLTPQSKARTCWNAVERLEDRGLLTDGRYGEVLDAIPDVRFKYTKAKRIIMAGERFIERGEFILPGELEAFTDPFEAREFLVSEVNGFGYKEASHFLRNIGLGEDLAILDRHILRNLLRAGAISGLPNSLTGRRYRDIEVRMGDVSRSMNIPMSHLDLLLWFRETGDVFK